MPFKIKNKNRCEKEEEEKKGGGAKNRIKIIK